MNSIADRSRDYHLSHPIYGYDGANRLSKTWADITGQSSTTPLVSYTYDAFGNQQTVTTRSDSSTSRVTSYDYDSANRVTKIEYPDGIVGDEEFGYDEAGGLLWKKDGNGKFTLYQYDDLRRLIAIYYLPGALPNPISYEGLTAGVTYTYHGGTNQRESMTETIGESQRTSSFEYDSQGRLKTYTPPLGLDTGYYVEYAYNNAGQKTGVSITDGTTTPYAVSYDYYANGWLKAVKYGGNPIASYSYDAVGNRTRVDYGNSTYTTFAYESGDPRYRLETITHYDPDDEALATFGYTRDDVGNPLSFSWLVGTTSYEWDYEYDAMSRLASATPPGVPLPAQAGGTYAYDWVGNIKATQAGNPWTYNAADQLTLWPDMHSYEYNENGALTAVKTADGTSIRQSFTYHPDGLMNEAEFNGQTLTNLWDADEHRVGFCLGACQSSTSFTFVFDPTASVPAVIKELTPGDYYFYVREPDGSLIARVGPETMHYYHFDELGSTRLITENSGIVTDRYSYDAYGAVLTHEASDGTISQPYQYVGRLGYYTHYQAPEFECLQLGVRFYEPETGRFERLDPLPQPRQSGYVYADSSPPTRADPTGLWGVGLGGWAGLAAPGFGGQISCSAMWCQDENTGRWTWDMQCSFCVGPTTPGIAGGVGPRLSNCMRASDLLGRSWNIGYAPGPNISGPLPGHQGGIIAGFDFGGSWPTGIAPYCMGCQTYSFCRFAKRHPFLAGLIGPQLSLECRRWAAGE